MKENLSPTNVLKVFKQYPRLKIEEKVNEEEQKLDELNADVKSYIKSYVKTFSNNVKVINTRWQYDIDKIIEKKQCIINVNRINDFRYINKYLESINSKILQNGMFIGCVETSKERKKRIFAKYPIYYAHPFYIGTFIMKRFFPKWGPTKKIYFWITKGENRFLSFAEILGRLISCGFKIHDYKEINNRLYYVVKKVESPKFDEAPTYGALIKLNRIGKDGKKIKVFKFRTMHPYAEYLQSYIYEKNNLKSGGKFKDDFRITTLGKIFRKYWLDELPMILNWIKTDLKLVGVRPLSQHYLNLYTENLKQMRLRHKPGLIPPFYADLPKTLDEIIESEERYLEAYEKNPISTDVKYFIKIVGNILFKNGRSC